MLQAIPCNQYQIVMAYFFNAIPHNPVNTTAMLHKIKFELLVRMDGIKEFAFVALYYVEAIFFGDGRRFP